MAETTAAEALGILGGSEKQPQSEQELITSIIAGMTRGEKCFVLLWDSERVQLAALIQQQAQQIEAQSNMLRLACRKLAAYRKCPPEICDLPYHPGDKECTKHWEKWLEQQMKEST